MKNTWRIALLTGLLVTAWACNDNALELPAEGEESYVEEDSHDHQHWEVIAMDNEEAVVDAFADGAATFRPDHEFHQVGLLMDGELGEELRFRARDLQGQWSAWEAVEVTWTEDEYHVGRIILGGEADRLELDGALGLENLMLEFYDEVMATQDVLTRELPLVTDTEEEEEGDDIRTVHQQVAPSSMVVSRAGWGARHPSKVCGGAHNPYRMSIHHTGIPSSDGGNPAARMRQMQAYHIDNRDWCDIGYHFVVSQSGIVYQGRSTSRRTGAHVGGQNTGNVGISLIGDYSSRTPPSAQMDAAAKIVRWVHQTDSISLNRTNVKGHREWPGQWTNCPGNNLLSLIPTILQKAAQSPSSSDSSSGSSSSSSTSSAPAWHLKNSLSSGAGDIEFNFARDSDHFIVGDWNGDGRMTPGVVRGNNWYLKNSFNGGTADISFQYGRSTDTPIVGDWNGDGRMTPGVIRGADWHLRNSNSGGSATTSFKYGRSSDTPVVGDWNNNGRMSAGSVR